MLFHLSPLVCIYSIVLSNFRNELLNQHPPLHKCKSRCILGHRDPCFFGRLCRYWRNKRIHSTGCGIRVFKYFHKTDFKNPDFSDSSYNTRSFFFHPKRNFIMADKRGGQFFRICRSSGSDRRMDCLSSGGANFSGSKYVVAMGAGKIIISSVRIFPLQHHYNTFYKNHAVQPQVPVF